MPVSLNADVGEGYGRYDFGNDAALMPLITSANIACGMHAGDPAIMAQTVRLAMQHGVSIGAHPGFNDIWGFGRRRIEMSLDDIETLVVYQVGALQGISAREGVGVRYVKPHGALNNLGGQDLDVALAIARAVRAVGDDLVFVGIAGSELVRAGERIGLTTLREAYADRRYDARGRLVPRDRPGSVIRDPAQAAAQVRSIIQEQVVISVDGGRVPVRADTICLHSDDALCVETARAVRDAIALAGDELVPIA